MPAVCGADSTPPLVVSIGELAANPERYDGREVETTGVLHVASETFAIYVDLPTFVCVDIDKPTDLLRYLEGLNDRAITVRGKFMAHDRSVGSIASCTSGRFVVEAWPIPDAKLALSSDDAAPGEIGRLLNEKAPDHRRIRALASSLLKAATANSGSALMDSYLPPGAAEKSTANGEAARKAWLSRVVHELSNRMAAEPRDDAIAVFETRPREQGGAGGICYCRRTTCNAEDIRNQFLPAQSHRDSYFCLPILQEQGKWYLDPGFITR